MLKQESSSKKGSPLARTKSKFVISKFHKQKGLPPSLPQAPPTFNDPLYQHLDGEVLNREQHNFGPWIQHERLKSRERGKAANGNNLGELPAIYRPQDTTSRYYQDLEAQGIGSTENATPAFPNIRDRNQRAFSLQNLRAASLQFNPSDDISQRTRVTGTKTPFFLKMHGYHLPKYSEPDNSKKSNFIYNYCLNEGDLVKPPPSKIRDILAKQAESYLKLSEKRNGIEEASTNQMLFRQLKQHRLNKLK